MFILLLPIEACFETDAIALSRVDFDLSVCDIHLGRDRLYSG